MNSNRHPFETTHWSVVLAAGVEDTVTSRQALEQLCELYWFPVYGFFRRQLSDVHQAEDVTQGFFGTLIENNQFQVADRERGRFRSFLIAAADNFLKNHFRAQSAQKRGGDRKHYELNFELDFANGEQQVASIGSALSPDQVFDRQWALVTLKRAMRELEQEYRTGGKQEWFDNLKHILSLTQDEGRTYQEIAERIGSNANQVKVAAHRLRGAFARKIREVITETVTSPEDVEDEIRCFFKLFS